jgi:ubiquinol-cytochrome c reductase cytochrome b subunit
VPIDQEEAYTLTQHVEPLPLAPVAEQGDLSDKELKAEQRRRKATRFWYLDALRKPTRAELEAAAHHDDDHGDGNGHGEIGNGHGDGHGTQEIGAGSGARRAQD